MTGITIVAVLGSTKSGKTTMAQRLVSRHGFVRARFAEPLKDMLFCLGLSREQLDGPQEIREQPCDLLCGRTPRYAMQTLGTEWRDLIDPALWARITRTRIVRLIEQGQTRFVIDDMRFPHEADMFRELGCAIVAVRRPEVEPSRMARLFSHLPIPGFVRALSLLLFGWRSVHVSETSWFRIDYDEDIDNIGTLDEFYSKIDDFAASLIDQRS